MEQLPFSLLTPIAQDSVWVPEVDNQDIITAPTSQEIASLALELSQSDIVVIDFETKGTRTWAPEERAVGVGFSWRTVHGDIGVRYLTAEGGFGDQLHTLLSAIPEDAVVAAHNVNFDAAWANEELRRCGHPPFERWTHCTYGLLKQLASEGWVGQQWGLKWAMQHLLGWSETNEVHLDNWLLSHGYHKQGPAKRELDTPAQHMATLRRWVAKGGKRKLIPDKAEMWRVPAPILGRYCALDCLATLDLYVRVLRPVLDRFPEFEWYHTHPWMYVNLLLVKQQRRGIRVDRQKLEAHGESLRSLMKHKFNKMHEEGHPLAPYIAQINDSRRGAALAELKAREPKKLKKDGDVSKGWLNWERSLKDPTFKAWNPGSGKDLRELLYEGGLVQVEDSDTDNERFFVLHGKHGPVELERTDSGLLSVDAEVFSQLGGEFAPLSDYVSAKTELSLVEAYLEHLHFDEPSQTWRLHAGWKVPGTLTGRLGGSEPNLQAIIKTLEFLDCFIPDEGCVWAEADCSALEPHVLAELSKDEALLKLYGPDANPNHDRYLFTVAGIQHPQFDEVRRYYNIDNPTKEGVKEAKAKCKQLRNLAKVLVLSGDYGAGAANKRRKCLLQGIDISAEDMADIHQGQLNLHSGVIDYRRQLEAEWHRRGGWILSGLGFPTPVHVDKIKDLVNRTVQRTGHDVHVIKVWMLHSLLEAEGIQADGVVWDFHDQYIYQVRAEDGGRAIEISERAVQHLNEFLGGDVRIKYGPRLVHSLSEAKMEEEWAERMRTLTKAK